MRQSHDARNLAALGSNACGAVARKGIVPSWILAQSVDGVYVFAKSLARLRRGSQRGVKINILSPIISPQTNAIALIGHDANERVLPIKAFQRGVLLPNSVARFDGEAERKRAGKLKAHNGMCDPGRAPVINRHVHACDL